MPAPCAHLLCEIIGADACSLAARRSRGCTPVRADRELAPEVLDEVRALLGRIDPAARDAPCRDAAARLATLVRREALEDRNLVALASQDEPDLAPALVALCFRRRDG